jgi:DHA1 family purine base/nucleoside efflux pump-like MFS transporter
MASRPKEELRVVACLFFILFMGVADNQVLSPLLPAIRSQFSKSTSDMGLLFTGYSFCAGLSVLLWGPISDAFGRKQGLLSGLIVFFAGSLVSFRANGYPLLLAGRIVTGMGASMLSLNCISYAADFFPYANRGWAMGSIFSSYFAALILGVPLASWLGDRFGWHTVFGTMGVIALVLFAATRWLLPSAIGQSIREAETRPADCARRYIGYLRIPTSLAALLSSLFASAGTTGFLAFLGAWLHDSFGIPGSKVGLVFIVAGAAALLASPFAGSIADRIGKRLQFVLSCGFLALFLLILPQLSWGLALFGVFGLVSLAAAFRQAPMEAVLTEIVPSESRGAFVALKNSFSQLGIGLAAMLSGILFERSGYAAVCLLAAGSNLLAAASMLFTCRKRHL